MVDAQLKEKKLNTADALELQNTLHQIDMAQLQLNSLRQKAKSLMEKHGFGVDLSKTAVLMADGTLKEELLTPNRQPQPQVSKNGNV